jgi:hypothetical protein
MDGDVEVSKSYHRTSFCPGDDISKQNAQVQAAANSAWTTEVISAFQSSLNKT